jgi:alpha-D-xyloside xylohydrolase
MASFYLTSPHRIALSRLAFGLCLLPALFINGPAAAATVSIDKNHESVLVVTDTNAIELQPWSSGTLRVEAASGATIPDKKSLSVIAAPNPAGWNVTEDADKVELKSRRLSAVVDKQTGLVSFFGADGMPLLQQTAWSFQPAQDPARDGLNVSASFQRANDEHFYGSGVIRDELSRPSAEIDLADNNTEIRIPILYSSRGYGFFWDNTSRGKLSLTPDTVTWDSSAGDLADFYIFAGPTADATIAEYRNLTGEAPLFPKWAYGLWFSRNKFNRQQEILDAAKKFRDRQIPVDMIVQDYYYWKPDHATNNGTGWGSHQFTPDRYPDPKGMIDTLHNQDHLHFMAVIWPKFDSDTDHAKELDAANALFPPNNDWAGPTLRYYDPFDPKAREIYGRQVMESLLPLGLDAFWMDGAEPEMDKKANTDAFAKFDSPAGPVSRLMDAFPLMHTTSVYTAERAATSDKRVVLLPRSSWAGEQRNAAADWTGDILQDWNALAWQIQGLPNYSITGLPYITTDIGGYNQSPDEDGELFIRWLEWGTFCPIYRIHGAPRPFPWEYGPDDEAIIKKFDQLRYRLLPYIYTQAGQITHENGTLMRPLVMDFQNDPKALDMWDEFLFGPSILVCPVYKPEHEMAATLDQWADKDGKPGGVTITGDEGGSRVNLIGDLARAVRDDRNGRNNDAPSDFADSFEPVQNIKAKSIRIEGTYTPKEMGQFDLQVTGNSRPTAPATVTIDGNQVTPPCSGIGLEFSPLPLLRTKRRPGPFHHRYPRDATGAAHRPPACRPAAS